MAKTRNTPGTQVVRDGTNDLSIRFYISDIGNTPRVELQLPFTSGTGFVVIDRPVSDFSNLSASEKTQLRAFLTTIRDQAFTLESFI